MVDEWRYVLPVRWLSCSTLSDKRDDQRRRLSFERNTFWLEQRGNEERMTLQFHRAYLARFIIGSSSKRAGKERSLELGV